VDLGIFSNSDHDFAAPKFDLAVASP